MTEEEQNALKQQVAQQQAQQQVQQWIKQYQQLYSANTSVGSAPPGAKQKAPEKDPFVVWAEKVKLNRGRKTLYRVANILLGLTGITVVGSIICFIWMWPSMTPCQVFLSVIPIGLVGVLGRGVALEDDCWKKAPWEE